VTSLGSVRLQCNAPDCPAIRESTAGRITSARAAVASLRLRLRSVGWVCIDATDTDLCPLHTHLAADNQEATS
jgi:hypothetical protein